jgi:histone RNA hairpin-binding protein
MAPLPAVESKKCPEPEKKDKSDLWKGSLTKKSKVESEKPKEELENGHGEEPGCSDKLQNKPRKKASGVGPVVGDPLAAGTSKILYRQEQKPQYGLDLDSNSSLPGGKTENDPEVLARRRKQINFGKNTPEYVNYLTAIPK